MKPQILLIITDDNNNAIPTKIDPSILVVIKGIINNDNEINYEITVTDIKTEPEPAVVQEAKTTLTEILTGQSDIEYIYIHVLMMKMF